MGEPGVLVGEPGVLVGESGVYRVVVPCVHRMQQSVDTSRSLSEEALLVTSNYTLWQAFQGLPPIPPSPRGNTAMLHSGYMQWDRNLENRPYFLDKEWAVGPLGMYLVFVRCKGRCMAALHKPFVKTVREVPQAQKPEPETISILVLHVFFKHHYFELRPSLNLRIT